MTNAVGIRYAKALFDLAKESKSVDATEASLNAFQESIDASPELAGFLSSPLLGRDEQAQTIAAIGKKAGLDATVQKTLGLMASKRRLMEVPAMIAAFSNLAREERDEVTAEVVSAEPLSAAQEKALAASLKKKVGKDVALTTEVDESLLGGLIVKLGSKMFDSSVKGKLSKLHNAMKEVG